MHNFGQSFGRHSAGSKTRYMLQKAKQSSFRIVQRSSWIAELSFSSFGLVVCNRLTHINTVVCCPSRRISRPAQMDDRFRVSATGSVRENVCNNSKNVKKTYV